MIRDRMFGSDHEFCAWMRSQSRELPSYSATCGFVATDVDLLLHRYLDVVDGIGTREIQALMILEVKTRGGRETKSQADTWFKSHMSTKFKTRTGGSTVRHFGVSWLFLSGTSPDDSRIEWGRFNARGAIVRKEISREVLFELMRFERHPNSLEKEPFRRHHKTTVISQVVSAGRLFPVEVPVIKRS